MIITEIQFSTGKKSPVRLSSESKEIIIAAGKEMKSGHRNFLLSGIQSLILIKEIIILYKIILVI